MANPEHLAVVRNGKAEIDAWRTNNAGKWMDLEGADLREVDLSHANLSHAGLRHADFRGANLSEANLQHANAPHASFKGADLTCLEISGANLAGAEFDSTDARGANLNLANLTRAVLSYSDFSEAILADADLSLAILRSTRLARANFTGVSLRETIISDCDLTECIGLATVEHRGLSTIGTDSLIRTARGAGGELSFQQEAFFIGAGVPSSFLEDVQMRAKSDAMKLYPALLTFGLSDTKFAYKLFRDLRKSQIICWKCDDASYGQSIESDTGRGIHSYEKLIVVCSKDSLNCTPVMEEIVRALRKERWLKDQGAIDTDVLFLVRRDHYMESGWNHYLKGALQSKYSGDFTDDASYYKQVGLLINALHLSVR